jgi:hypothetical protein
LAVARRVAAFSHALVPYVNLGEGVCHYDATFPLLVGGGCGRPLAVVAPDVAEHPPHLRQKGEGLAFSVAVVFFTVVTCLIWLIVTQDNAVISHALRYTTCTQLHTCPKRPTPFILAIPPSNLATLFERLLLRLEEPFFLRPLPDTGGGHRLPWTIHAGMDYLLTVAAVCRCTLPVARCVCNCSSHRMLGWRCLRTAGTGMRTAHCRHAAKAAVS